MNITSLLQQHFNLKKSECYIHVISNFVAFNGKIVVVISAQALGGIPFTFQHPSIISQLMEYSQCLKLCILEGDLDSLQSFPLYIKHILGMNKATICTDEPPNNHGW
jgi:hypothetical protein